MAQAPLSRMPTGVVWRKEPVDTVAPVLRLLALSWSSNQTCVFTVQGAGELVSSTMGAVAVMKPLPTVMSVDSTKEGAPMAKNRDLPAPQFRRYCASADVGQGAP